MKTRLLAVFVLFGLFITANSQVPGYVPQNGLVGWWPFNGNANDENGNDGSEFLHDSQKVGFSIIKKTGFV